MKDWCGALLGHTCTKPRVLPIIKPCQAPAKKFLEDRLVSATVAKFLSSTQYLATALGRDDLPGQRGGHVVITYEGPLERAGAVGHRTQINGVPGQLVRRYLGVNNRVTR